MNFKECLADKKYDIKGKNEPKCDSNSQKQVKESIEKYQNYSHEELMREFMAKTSEMKMKGELTTDKINDLYNKLEPMLTPEQMATLKNLLNKI